MTTTTDRRGDDLWSALNQVMNCGCRDCRKAALYWLDKHRRNA